MRSRAPFRGIVLLLAAALSAPAPARAAPAPARAAPAPAGSDTITIDVECNGRKVGEIKVTVTGWVDGNRGGVKARGGFKLTSAKVAEEECWCDQYTWFQTIHITGTDAPEPPGGGADDYTDPNPGWEYRWGGGQTEGDYAPFLYNLDDSRCSNEKMVNRNFKTLYFSDKPARHTSVADDGDFTWEATLCLVCLPSGTPSGATQDSNGSIKILACLKYGFKITKNAGGSYTLDKIGPEAVDGTPDPGSSAFSGDLALLAASGRRLGWFFAPDVDLATATNGFTTSATVTGKATLAFRKGSWIDLGSGLAGTLGVPLLVADSSLVGGAPISITLSNALPNSTAFLCFGLAALDAPFKAGTLVPDIGTPPGTVLVLPTGPIGAIPVNGTWPPNVPPDLQLYLQCWIVDPGGPSGFSASNAVKGATP